MSISVFSQPAIVGFFDADPALRLAPTAYWRIFQNAAAGHASLLSAATEELRKSGQTWMLSQMRLEVSRHPRLGDSIVVETWPSTRIKGARAYRDYVLKSERGEVLARGASLWVIVDLATRRPVRIPDSLAALSVDPGYEIPALTGALAMPTGEASSAHFRAVWSDADQNEHVNNVALLRWSVDALPLQFLERSVLVSAEAQYRAEVSVGEQVQVKTSLADNTATQSIHSGERLVGLVCSRWRSLDAPPVAP
ncbi:MAG: acyl-[acyl-carrier-protein] thioesterase [Acidobacteriota bacterium]|jgi:medium-chain acyl-[acyl-carrier-protein] hydrolase